jgi:predicted DsbA family dithiol-disulfide isomerase
MEPPARTPAPGRLTIDVWADVWCPWCHLGQQRLQTAIGQSPHADDIDVRIHTFQLDPDGPATVTPTLQYLSSSHGLRADQARSLDERMARLAAAEDLTYQVDRPARNTFDLLRPVHLAAEYGLARQYPRAMQAEVFGGNHDAFEPGTLARSGQEPGIPAGQIRQVRATDRYGDAVRADHHAAVRMGARGVPFTVLAERLGIPGAVTTSQHAAAINQAWQQANGR